MKQVYLVERTTNTNKEMFWEERSYSKKKEEMNVFTPLKYVLSPSCCKT